MSERPILFQPEMIRAILDGRKTVTRRVGSTWARVVTGDRLWVRERWRGPKLGDDLSPTRMAEMCLEAGYAEPWAPIWFSDGSFNRAVHPHDAETMWGGPGRWRSPLHMPRWASRLTLEVVSVTELPSPMGEHGWRMPELDDTEAQREGFADRASFLAAWASMHPEHRGPIWRVEFARSKAAG